MLEAVDEREEQEETPEVQEEPPVGIEDKEVWVVAASTVAMAALEEPVAVQEVAQ